MRKGTRNKVANELLKEEVKDGQLSDTELKATRMSPAAILEASIKDIRQEVEREALKKAEGNHQLAVQKAINKLNPADLCRIGRSISELAQMLMSENILPTYSTLVLEKEKQSAAGGKTRDSNLEEINEAIRTKLVEELACEELERLYRAMKVAVLASGSGSEVIVPMFLSFGQHYRSQYLKEIVSLRSQAASAVMELHLTNELGLLPESTPTEGKNLKEFSGEIERLFNSSSGLVFCHKSLNSFKNAGEYIEALGKYLNTSGLVWEVPVKLNERQQAKTNAQADAAERQYRSSDEARVLRLCRELSEGPRSRPAAQKTAKQLLKLSTKACVSILNRFSERMEDFQSLQQSFIAALAEARENEPQQGETNSPASQQSEEEVAVAVTGPTQEELREIRRRDEERVAELLLECGVEDDAVLEECLAHSDLGQISLDIAVVRAYTSLDVHVRGLLIETNREIITGGLGVPLQSFLKQVQKTLELSEQLPGYEDAFDLTMHPEHYAFPSRLERTASTAKRLHEMLSVIRQERAAQREAAARAERGEKTMPEAEQALVERLRQYVDKPYVAYAVIRLSFLQSGGYNRGAVGRSMRDRRLQSAFNSSPVSQDVRECERQLVKAGFLKDDPRSTKAQGNLILCPPRDIEDASMRELVLALTDADTLAKAQMPKLPFE